MTESERRRLVVWGSTPRQRLTMIVMEQPDGTFIAWAGPDETVGVDYVEDCPEHALAAAMFALKRKSGHVECSPGCSAFEMRMHTIWVTQE